MAGPFDFAGVFSFTSILQSFPSLRGLKISYIIQSLQCLQQDTRYAIETIAEASLCRRETCGFATITLGFEVAIWVLGRSWLDPLILQVSAPSPLFYHIFLHRDG